MKAAFTITSELLPAPQWFHMRFRNGWGAYIMWGKHPIQGQGSKAAEVQVTYDDIPTGETHGYLPPEKVAEFMLILRDRRPHGKSRP